MTLEGRVVDKMVILWTAALSETLPESRGPTQTGVSGCCWSLTSIQVLGILGILGWMYLRLGS